MNTPPGTASHGPTTPLRLLVLPPLVTALIAVCLWQGMRGADDLRYAERAFAFFHGALDGSPVGGHQAGRLGLVLPLAVVFAVFGVSDVTLALLPFAATVLTSALIAWLGNRLWGPAVGLVAGIAYALLPLTAHQATFFLPESVATAELCAAACLFVAAHDRTDRGSTVARVAAGLLIGAAYMATEAGILLLPVLYATLLVTRGIRRHDLWIAAGFCAVFGAELLYHAAVHGHPLYRYAFAGAYANEPMVRSANANLTYRLLKAYPSLFVYPSIDFGLFGGLFIVSGLWALRRFRQYTLPLIWAGTILLFYNFMSASFTRYVALPVATRLLMPAFPPLLLLFAKAAVDVWRRTEGRLVWRTLAITAACGVAGVSALSLYLGTSPGLTAARASNARVAADVMRDAPAVAVIADPMTLRDIRFHRGFRAQDTFLTFDSASRVLDRGATFTPAPDVYVVLNGPVFHEEEITGHRYGRGVSISDSNRTAAARFSSGSDSAVLSAHVRSGRLLPALLPLPAVSYLAGRWWHRVATALSQPSPATEVRVFRYTGRPTRPAPAPVSP